ncbi:MAG: HAD family hydrolase [Cyanobacteria bacterium RM1_2_2]|nr:HAD family hydrolase [Cyanobacteria bacterium RM1_2_2]
MTQTLELPKYQLPKVIFLDAVGTLFGVKGSVGAIYGSIAREFGVHADDALIDQAFFQSFKAAPPMAFPDALPSDIPQAEYRWWKRIAYQTFQQVGVVDQFQNFSVFFAALYAHFATADPWFIYPDVLAALTYWHSQNVPLGVISNFDTRLYPVLTALQLTEFFSSITISTEAGFAKPAPQVFQIALEKHHCKPDQAWHIGDSFKQDYQGAKTVGIRAFWLKRDLA